MAHLPTDILSHKIFLKLPFKSLLCCRFVCKAWNRVICDPEFVRMHHLLNQHHPKEKLLFATSTIMGLSHRHIYSADCEAREGTMGLSHRHIYSVDCEASEGTSVADAVKLNLNFPAEVKTTEIFGSSNGLLCMAVRYQKIRYSNDDDDDILICNPSTGDSKLIRDTHAPRLCDIYASPLVGFAYDYSIDDGKFVRVTNFSCKEPGRPITSRVDIYSIKSNSWNIVKYGAPLFGVCPHQRGCAVNGSIYWPVDYQSNFRIMAFKLRDNKFRNLQPPRNFLPFYHTYLMALGGTLSIFQLAVVEFAACKRLQVWTMKEDDEKEEWIKLMDVDASFLYFGKTQFLGPICLMRNGKILMLFNEQLKRSKSEMVNKLVFYDAERNKDYFRIREISHRYTFNVVTYVESLLSPNSIAWGA